ncbi:GLPGLI family protein [Chryseobacterium indologenes]|uniref:GLPGLI family protein n=1 Tax=Chryseobacterium indologenes TaxID=253 RepID=UPI000B51CF75|nr:GLPGLI family protein [Chryseobacterium indologenes]ASE62952.1 GLPGLI family protein [Chryseobacterium indologenes]VFA42492.1 GLPGLI family protein [Chryseobacterium indologenes]
MKLIKSILTLIICFIFLEIHSQNMMVVYDYKFKTDSLSSTYEEEPMFLYVNNKKSLFSSYARFKTDSLYQLDKKTDFSNGQIMWKINKDYSSNVVRENQYIYPNLYSFEDKYILKWELINETKRNLGFTLYKAKTYFRGRTWEVWYCPEIAINDGPYKFYGLPGLIFEIKDTQSFYIFSLIKMYKTTFNPYELPSSQQIEKQEYISKNKYLKLKKLDTDDPARSFKIDLYKGNIILAEGRDPNEMIRGIEKRAKEKQAKYNNPIELNKK